MRVVTDLAKLQRMGLRQVWGIQRRLQRCGVIWSKDRERVVALCLIDAQNAWSLFVRHFFISCLLGGRLVSGVRATTGISGITTTEAAMRFSVSVAYPQRQRKKKLGPLDEPRWHLPSVLLSLASSAGLSNHAQIVTALAVPGRAFDDLPRARNFFAHRSRRTASALTSVAAKYHLGAHVRPGELPCNAYLNMPYSIAYAWVTQLKATMGLLPQ